MKFEGWIFWTIIKNKGKMERWKEGRKKGGRERESLFDFEFIPLDNF